jgi:hypothetical protein
MGFAASELARRGIEARPSFDSLCSLLTSENADRRGLGLSLMSALYPSVAETFPEGCSNAEPPEVWRERVASPGGPGGNAPQDNINK